MSDVPIETEVEELRREVSRLKVIEEAMREWFDANQKEDTARWLEACRRMDTLMGGKWVVTESTHDYE